MDRKHNTLQDKEKVNMLNLWKKEAEKMQRHSFVPRARLTQFQLRSSSEANFALQNEINFALK